MRMSLFVDDFLIFAEISKIQDDKHTVIQTLLILGHHINWDKSEPTPSTSHLYIGFRIINGTKEGTPIIKVPGDHMKKLCQLIRNILKRHTTTRRLAKITGLCISVTKAALPGKLILHHAYRLLASRCNWDPMQSYSGQTYIISGLTWWIPATHSCNGAPLLSKPVDDNRCQSPCHGPLVIQMVKPTLKHTQTHDSTPGNPCLPNTSQIET